MKGNRNFLRITAADLIVRSAYQMGKSPLLPLFAATLGANGALLGLIVSVSTLTGMLFKPMIGMLSDRWGRWVWLLLGTALFAVMPFFYVFINTPEQLFAIRLIHGMATAIYGPVTLAFVAEQTVVDRAEWLGWFGMARSAGYIIGPAVAGLMLLVMKPEQVFLAIGLLSCIAFLTVLQLPKIGRQKETTVLSLRQQLSQSLRIGGRTPAIWLAGGLNALTFLALYAVKAFLPVHALDIGMNIALVGAFFSFQEGVHMIGKPWGGAFRRAHGLPDMHCIGNLFVRSNSSPTTPSPNGI